MRFAPPPAVLEIARRLAVSGYEVWAVGGAVRDALAGLPGGDWDLATNARPEDVRRSFRRTVPIGIEHGTVGVLAGDGVLYEVTTFRRDVETFGRHAVVEFADDIDTDLSRRDFTCNAIAWNPLEDRLRDPFGGLADLEARRLRTVGEPADRFAEDWLRVLRALRFAGHFAMRIEATTWGALCTATQNLPSLSAERVREELAKVLGRTRPASRALDLYRESGVLEVLFPELAAVVGLRTDGEDADPWARSLDALDRVPPARTLLRFALLFHALGMPSARTRDLRGGWRYTGHAVAGGRKAREVMRRLRASNADTDRVSRLVALQDDWFPPDAPDAGVRRWLARIRPAFVNDLFRMRIALWRAAPADGGDRDILERVRHARAVLAAHPVLDLSGLAIDGSHLVALGLEPGPRFGVILQRLLARVIEEPALNERDTLLELARAESARP
ncbi:MAG: CCA tRNA nucleotidyltransferase [Gemmatimonadota bacterium]